MSKVKLF